MPQCFQQVWRVNDIAECLLNVGDECICRLHVVAHDQENALFSVIIHMLFRPRETAMLDQSERVSTYGVPSAGTLRGRLPLTKLAQSSVPFDCGGTFTAQDRQAGIARPYDEDDGASPATRVGRASSRSSYLPSSLFARSRSRRWRGPADALSINSHVGAKSVGKPSVAYRLRARS